MRSTKTKKKITCPCNKCKGRLVDSRTQKKHEELETQRNYTYKTVSKRTRIRSDDNDDDEKSKSSNSFESSNSSKSSNSFELSNSSKSASSSKSTSSFESQEPVYIPIK